MNLNWCSVVPGVDRIKTRPVQFGDDLAGRLASGVDVSGPGEPGMMLPGPRHRGVW